MTNRPRHYTAAEIRDLLDAAFDSAGLIALCQGGFPQLSRKLGLGRGLRKDEIINTIVDHFLRHGDFSPLLDAVKEQEPELYGGFETKAQKRSSDSHPEAEWPQIADSLNQSAVNETSLNIFHTGKHLTPARLPHQPSSRELEDVPSSSLSTLLDQIISIGDQHFPLLAAVCATAGTVMGGLLWNMLNLLLDWAFHLGGSGNEPHGFHAFIWGSVSALPVISFALLACYKYIPLNRESFRKVAAITSLYTISGGIGAVIFYDSGFRNLVEAAKLGYGSQELVIVVVWSTILSTAISLPLLILNRTVKNILDARRLLLQIPLSTVFSFLAVLVSLFVRRPMEELEQLRGFFAAIALRLGLFTGVVLSISGKLSKNEQLNVTKHGAATS